ncbi:phage antirepressor protein [Pseudomonas floridensis]|uniref:Phage antirepressor protein n=1 Tax=Pseudomonas floridensis TaxID=1958950 RepID=A0A1X0N513_9PSED|nr:Bro-N domain-containing protein [Pseudomonas floridensis]ORC57992.1 phage antirepressor protein [Pseudomonas floridensis]
MLSNRFALHDHKLKTDKSSLVTITFHRHNRQLQALLHEHQPWFSARDLGRLIGWPLNERTVRKLDADQYRMMTLEQQSGPESELMVSESGAYAMLVHHYHAENRGLRQWLTNEVVATLRNGQVAFDDHTPHLSMLHWPELSVSLLHGQSEPWIRLRDMPMLLEHPQMQVEPTPRPASKSWWRSALPAFRLD